MLQKLFGDAMKPGKRAKSGPAGPRRPSATAAGRLSRGDHLTLADRIMQRRDALGLSNAEVERRAGIGVNALYRIINGGQYSPQFSTLKALARALECQLAWLIGETDDIDLRTATIPLIGQAEVGVFRTEKPQQSGTIGDSVPLDQRFANNPRFGVVVADGSLDEIIDAAGAARIVGLVIATSAEMAVEHGKIYLVHRANSDGQTETSFRRAAVYHDHYEFAPLFRDPAKNKRYAVKVSRDDLTAGQTIEIGGLFYAATCQYL